MLKIEDIIKELPAEHQQIIRKNLESNFSYSEYSTQIFDHYLKDSNSGILEKVLNLDSKSFKVFERIVLRCILSFYQIEDNSPRDLILSTAFYAINGGTEKSKKEHTQQLEEIFHQLKKYQLEFTSSDLLQELKMLHKDSPLEAVYIHLYNKYAAKEAKAEMAIAKFKEFNTHISANLLSEKNTKGLIKQYKAIRNLREQDDNLVIEAIFQLAKLNLVVIGQQNQLLMEEGETTDSLTDLCSILVNKLPFGIFKYYMQNILDEVKVIHLIRKEQIELAKEEVEKIGRRRILANNLNFSNEYLNRLLDQKINHFSNALKYLSLDPFKWDMVQNSPLFGGARLSSS